MPARHLTPDPLRVTPELIGQPLASPLRRAVALALDLAIVVLPTVAVALAASALALQRSDPAALRALTGSLATAKRAAAGVPDSPEQRARTHAFWRDLAPLLLRLEAPGMPHSAAAATEEGRLEDAAAILADYDLLVVLAIAEGAEPVPRPQVIQLELAKLIPRSVRALALLGVPALYFTLGLRGRRGATPGKRLAGVRVARLDGHCLDVFEAFERFLGYLHIPATLGYSLLDLWRDPNRRLPHDRVAGTVVLRAAKARRPVSPPAREGSG